MLGAALHKTLYRWFFRVPSQSIASMRLFALTDVVLMTAIPLPVWLRMIASLRDFQRGLITRQWPGLSEIYPRSLMWTYLYLLFWWARYCDVLGELCAHPDRALLAEMFIRYVCAIDAYVDGWDSAHLWRDRPIEPQRMPEPRAIAAQMSGHLDRIRAAPAARLALLRLMAGYRGDARRAMCRWAAAENTPAEIAAAKERTAGNMWRCWACLLGCLYEVPPAVAQTASDQIFWFGMGLQVVDDVTDFPVDYTLHAQNFLVALIGERAAEEQRVREHLLGSPAAMLDAGWARRNLPDAYRAARDAYDRYARRLLDDGHQPALSRELFNTLESFRRIQG